MYNKTSRCTRCWWPKQDPQGCPCKDAAPWAELWPSHISHNLCGFWWGRTKLACSHVAPRPTFRYSHETPKQRASPTRPAPGSSTSPLSLHFRAHPGEGWHEGTPEVRRPPPHLTLHARSTLKSRARRNLSRKASLRGWGQRCPGSASARRRSSVTAPRACGSGRSPSPRCDMAGGRRSAPPHGRTHGEVRGGGGCRARPGCLRPRGGGA